MALRGLAFLCLGLLAGGCVQSTLEVASDANMPRATKNCSRMPPTRRNTIPEPYKRQSSPITARKRQARSWWIARALSLLRAAEGKAIRYGITVGEDALAFSGVAKVGRKEEWPSWTHHQRHKKRLGNIPGYVAPGRTTHGFARAVCI